MALAIARAWVSLLSARVNVPVDLACNVSICFLSMCVSLFLVLRSLSPNSTYWKVSLYSAALSQASSTSHKYTHTQNSYSTIQCPSHIWPNCATFALCIEWPTFLWSLLWHHLCHVCQSVCVWCSDWLIIPLNLHQAFTQDTGLLAICNNAIILLHYNNTYYIYIILHIWGQWMIWISSHMDQSC